MDEIILNDLESLPELILISYIDYLNNEWNMFHIPKISEKEFFLEYPILEIHNIFIKDNKYNIIRDIKLKKLV